MHYLRQSQDTVRRNAHSKQTIPAPLLTAEYIEIEERVKRRDFKGVIEYL